LDGKQHLALGDKLGAEGVAKMLGSVGLKGDASATKTKKGKGQRKPKEVQNKKPRRHILSLSMDLDFMSLDFECFIIPSQLMSPPHAMVQVTPETPLEKAVKLQEKVLKDANSCRTPDCTIV